MSYRKAKLLLQQKKLQEQQASTTQNPKQQEQEQQTYVPPKKKNNLFQAFGDDSDDKQYTKNQKQQSQQTTKKLTQNNTNQTKKNKNKKKKKKNKQEKEQNNEEALKKKQQEQIDRIFKEMGMESKKKQEQTLKQAQQWEQILSINQSKFNYEKQLRRHFGNTGLGEQKQQQPDLSKRQQKLQKHLKKAMKKSVLSPGVKDVFIIREKFEVDRNEEQIKFLPTKKYDHYQAQYETIRNSNDINALFMFMQTHPEHVDSIYAVGQFLRLQGNYREADNLIQRVIYIYEMAASFDINQFIRQDIIKKYITYDTYSTSLFMSLFKFMDILGKKGCYRAALEYNKFLLKININDPTACILCMDFNAISAKCSDYLISFIKGFGQYVGNQKSSLYLLPNFTYSLALAKYYIENPEKPEKDLIVQQNNTETLLKFTDQDWKAALVMPNDNNFVKQNAKILLLRAILVYPKLIVEIANKNQYAKQFLNFGAFVGNQKKTFKDLLAHQFWSIVPASYSYNFLKLESVADSTGLDRILEVYVQRSKILWKSNQIMLWVKAAMGFVLNKIDNNQFEYQGHLERLCLEQGGGLPVPFQLRRYANISKHNFSDRVERIDLANIQDNQRQQAPRNQNRMQLQGNPLTMFLNSLLPWVNLPNSQGNEDPDMPDIQQDD